MWDRNRNEENKQIILEMIDRRVISRSIAEKVKTKGSKAGNPLSENSAQEV